MGNLEAKKGQVTFSRSWTDENSFSECFVIIKKRELDIKSIIFIIKLLTNLLTRIENVFGKRT